MSQLQRKRSHTEDNIVFDVQQAGDCSLDYMKIGKLARTKTFEQAVEDLKSLWDGETDKEQDKDTGIGIGIGIGRTLSNNSDAGRTSSGTTTTTQASISPTNFQPEDDVAERYGGESYSSDILSTYFGKEIGLVFKKPVCSSKAFSHESFTQVYQSICAHIAEVCCENGLNTNTFLLAISLLDRALFRLLNTMKVKFRLLSCTCLLIASKVEEIYHPTVDALIAMSGFCFSKEKLLACEQMLLMEVFEFNVSTPTRYDFALRWFADATNLSDMERSLVSFFCDISVFDFNLNYFRASQVAAGILHLTLQITRERTAELWPRSLKECTTYNEEDLLEVVIRLRRLHWCCDDPIMKVVVDKYKSVDHHYVGEKMAVPYVGLRFDSKRVRLPRLESACVLRNHCFQG